MHTHPRFAIAALIVLAAVVVGGGRPAGQNVNTPGAATLRSPVASTA